METLPGAAPAINPKSPVVQRSLAPYEDNPRAVAKLHQARSATDGRPQGGFGTDVQTQYAFFECGLRPVGSSGMLTLVAIAFARARYISRKTGGNAVRSGAYNGRDKIVAERTGEVFYFAHRDAPDHHEVMLPEGAPEAFRDAGRFMERGRGGGEARRRAGGAGAGSGVAGQSRNRP